MGEYLLIKYVPVLAQITAIPAPLGKASFGAILHHLVTSEDEAIQNGELIPYFGKLLHVHIFKRPLVSLQHLLYFLVLLVSSCRLL